MNRIYSISAIVAIAGIIAGCDDYSDRYSDEYASVVRLDTYGEHTLKVWSTDTETPYSVTVLRSGHNTAAKASATLQVMTDAEWTDYAAIYGKTHYSVLPADCYRFADDSKNSATLNFDADTNDGTVLITLFNDKIGRFVSTLQPSELGDITVCIPLTLETNTGSALMDQKNLLIIPQYEKPALIMTPAGFDKVNCLPSSSPYEREYTVGLGVDNTWGFSAKIKNSQALVDRYNAANNTSYTLIKPEALEIGIDGSWQPWADRTLDFPVGTPTQSFRIRINPAKANPMDIMALEVTDPSLDLGIDDNTSSGIFYVAVKPSSLKLKNVTATSSTDDGTHTAKNLVDGRTTSFFSTQTTPHDGDPVYGEYVDFKLPTPIRYFAMDYISRFDSFGDGSGIPNEVDIYTSLDGSNWKKAGNITGMRRQFSTVRQTVSYGNFDAGEPVQYIRWAVVKGGANGNLDMREPNSTAHWSATALYIYGR